MRTVGTVMQRSNGNRQIDAADTRGSVPLQDGPGHVSEVQCQESRCCRNHGDPRPVAHSKGGFWSLYECSLEALELEHLRLGKKREHATGTIEVYCCGPKVRYRAAGTIGWNRDCIVIS